MKRDEFFKLWWLIQDIYRDQVAAVTPIAATITILEQVGDSKVQMRTLTIPVKGEGEI